MEAAIHAAKASLELLEVELREQRRKLKWEGGRGGEGRASRSGVTVRIVEGARRGDETPPPAGAI